MKKQFKTESKRLMDLMINSIYTNKEIFLREIISNASDAIDKLHYKSLTDKSVKINKEDLCINVSIDKTGRRLTISDNGIGMTKEELESNLGTIAKSGSFDFKNDNEKKENIDIIGQFGVGFYSAFMVASNVRVVSRAYGSDNAYEWESEGIDGYSINETDKDNYGTDVILTIREDSEEEYSKYLEEYEIRRLIKKYSDYITYPIKMNVTKSRLKDGSKDEYEEYTEEEIINSLVPIWKRNKKDITDEEYDTFYSDKFFDYEKPLRHIHTAAEGTISYNSLIYIPSHASFDYYSKEYEKGLQLYSNGVLIMEKCADLVPDYFSFVKGVVDSPDLTLNISRETLQQNRVLKTIASAIEKKIKKELTDMRDNNEEDYLKFYKDFGMQLKIGVYSNYGMNKDKIQDLLMFYSSTKEKLVSLSDYCSRNKDYKDIYYACGETTSKIDMLPQVESLKSKDKEILYCTDYVDEFVFKTLMKFDDKEFKNVCSDSIETDKEESKELDKLNKKSKDMFNVIKDEIGVSEVKFTNKLSIHHAVCLSNKGDVSIEMEKVMKEMPIDNGVEAEKVLEINESHPIADKLKELYKNDKDELKEYAKILYAQARLIEGLPIDNPTEISNLICDLMAK